MTIKLYYRLRLLFRGLFFLLLSSSICFANDTNNEVGVTRLEQITVEACPINPTKQGEDRLYSGSEITSEGLTLVGIGGMSSTFKALSILPGINPELTDPTGIGGAEMRLRGIKSMFTGFSVEGIPNYGIMSVGPRDYIYDLENMAAVKLYRGATPAALCGGIGNRGGAIALSYARPADDFTLQLEQSFGPDSLRRSFFRLDSGLLFNQSKFFLSGSYTKADKWKGAGEVGGRNHITLGVSQKFNDNLDAELFYNYNQVDQDLYKGLNYDQARNISHHYRDDYLEDLTGTPADKDFYGYHHSETENHDVMTIINYSPKEHHTFTLKPYYSSEDKKWFDGGADKYVETERFGSKLDYAGDWCGALISAGYWYENFDLEKYLRKNKINDQGRNYAGWAYLAENRGDGHIHSPYLQLDRSIGPFSCQAGIKYFFYHEPANRAYLSDKSTPSSYSKALNDNLGIDYEMSLEAVNYQKWLPSFSLGYQASPDLEFYLNYGRNYMRPYAYVPIAMVFSGNRKKFQVAGLSLQDLFDKWKLETSDNFDFGCRFEHFWFSLSPTIFYARHQDLLFVANDSRVGVSYHQNVGDATVWGAELECNIYPTDNLILFFNPSYTKATFDNDLVSTDSILETGGNDLPDTPRWLLKAGFIYYYKNFTVSPSIKYVDQRYGDIENREEIDSYTTVDLTIEYLIKNPWFLQEASLKLEFTNLFDKKYVGTIRADDDGFNTSQYYSGIPFTTVCKISGKF